MSEETKETKLCKHCKMEIPKDAKVCPHCRKKQKGGILKWIIIVVLALIIIMAFAGGGDSKPKAVETESQQDTDTVDTSQNQEEQQSEEATEEKDTFGIGESAELNGVQVTMTDYEESEGSEYNEPTDGNVYVLIEFEIFNDSDKEISVSSLMSFEAYADDYALNYSLNALMEKDGATQLDGTIAAGKKMKGVVGYEVPADWQNIEIHFTDNVWSNNKFKFLIEK